MITLTNMTTTEIALAFFIVISIGEAVALAILYLRISRLYAKNASEINKRKRGSERNSQLELELKEAKKMLNQETHRFSWKIKVEVKKKEKAQAELETFKREMLAALEKIDADKISEIESLKSDRQKLFEIAKGATAKLAEMNVALEGLEVNKEKDWSKEAFPGGYLIPEGTRVIALTNGGFSEKVCVAGDKGTVASYFSEFGTSVLFDGRPTNMGEGYFMYNGWLSPLNPLDHPNHPNFRG